MKNLVLLIVVATTLFWCGYKYGIAKTTIIDEADVNIMPPTNFSGADLTGANLTGANLTGADLSATFLFHAFLSGANLSGATDCP